MAKSKEEKQETRQLRELRKQNISLKRQVQQLQKRNRSLEVSVSDSEDTAAAEDEQRFEKVSVRSRDEPRCPKCGFGDINCFELRKIMYYKCTNCESKGRFE